MASPRSGPVWSFLGNARPPVDRAGDPRFQKQSLTGAAWAEIPAEGLTSD